MDPQGSAATQRTNDQHASPGCQRAYPASAGLLGQYTRALNFAAGFRKSIHASTSSSFLQTAPANFSSQTLHCSVPSRVQPRRASTTGLLQSSRSRLIAVRSSASQLGSVWQRSNRLCYSGALIAGTDCANASKLILDGWERSCLSLVQHHQRASQKRCCQPDRTEETDFEGSASSRTDTRSLTARRTMNSTSTSPDSTASRARERKWHRRSWLLC